MRIAIATQAHTFVTLQKMSLLSTILWGIHTRAAPKKRPKKLVFFCNCFKAYRYARFQKDRYQYDGSGAPNGFKAYSYARLQKLLLVNDARLAPAVAHGSMVSSRSKIASGPPNRSNRVPNRPESLPKLLGNSRAHLY